VNAVMANFNTNMTCQDNVHS